MEKEVKDLVLDNVVEVEEVTNFSKYGKLAGLAILGVTVLVVAPRVVKKLRNKLAARKALKQADVEDLNDTQA